jgi:hypothetical protein
MEEIIPQIKNRGKLGRLKKVFSASLLENMYESCLVFYL